MQQTGDLAKLTPAGEGDFKGIRGKRQADGAGDRGHYIRLTLLLSGGCL